MLQQIVKTFSGILREIRSAAPMTTKPVLAIKLIATVIRISRHSRCNSTCQTYRCNRKYGVKCLTRSTGRCVGCQSPQQQNFKPQHTADRQQLSRESDVSVNRSSVSVGSCLSLMRKSGERLKITLSSNCIILSLNRWLTLKLQNFYLHLSSRNGKYIYIFLMI